MSRVFWGVVTSKEWIPDPKTNRQVRGFVGRVTIKSAEEMLGFKTSSGELNWMAVIGDCGQGKEAVTLPGCQIRVIFETTDVSHDMADYAYVGEAWSFGRGEPDVPKDETVEPAAEEIEKF